MRTIPKASKVKITFYRGITIPDIIIGLVALALIAVTVSTNFTWRWYLALGILCITVPLYLTMGDERLYVHIAYLLRFLFSRKKFRGVSVKDVCPYEKSENGFVRSNDGTLFCAIEIEPVNFEMLSESAQETLIDYGYARVLDSIGEGESWQLVKTEMPLILDRQIQDEMDRADNLASMKSKGQMTDEEFIPRCDAAQARLLTIDSYNSSEIRTPHYFLCLIGRDEENTRRKLDDAVTLLGSAGISAHVLDEAETLTFLRSANPGEFNPRDRLAEIPQPESIRFGLSETEIDGTKVSYLAITRYPLQVPNAWADRLCSIEGTTVSMKMTPVPKEKAIKRIDAAILELETKRVGKESEFQEGDTHLSTLRDLLDDLQQNNETLFDVTVIIAVRDEPKSVENRRKVKDTLREMGFAWSDLLGRQMDGSVSSLVSGTELTKIRHGIQTSSLAASFPFCGAKRMEKEGLLIGSDGLPAFVNFFRRDEKHVNSNLVIIGQSGSGKSYASKSILTALSTEGAKVYVLDPESEYGTLARNLKGASIDASDGNRGRINPFEILPSMDDEGGETNSYYAHLQFLEQFYRTVLQGIDRDSLEELNRLTEEVYAEKGIRPGSNLKSLGHEDYPTFEDLCLLAEKRLASASDAYEENCLRVLVNWLSRFRKGGRDSALWNGPTTFSPKENFVSFDFQRLLANHNDVTANAQMLLLLRWLENEVIRNRAENKVSGNKRRVVVAIDEAHLFIDEKYPIALDFMYQLAKRIRKYDGMLIIITQNVRDFAGTPEIARKSSAVISVSQYSMIFALSPNDMNDLTSLYENSGGLNEEEKNTIVHMPRGSCFFLSAPGEREVLSIETDDYAERLFGDNQGKEELNA